MEGKQLPDIDLLIGGTDPGSLVACEVKWQLSGSSTREVINRDEYLKKDLRQLEAIREFLTANPQFLLSRGLLNRETQPSEFAFLLLCKGHLGSETIQTEGILKCDYDVFLEAVHQQGVSRASHWRARTPICLNLEPTSLWNPFQSVSKNGV